MKCARQGCKERAAEGRMYCSRICRMADNQEPSDPCVPESAPQENREDAEWTAKSSMLEHGADSETSCDDEKPSGSGSSPDDEAENHDPASDGQTCRNGREIDELNNRSQDERNTMRSGELSGTGGIGATKNPSVPPSTTGDSEEIPANKLPALSGNSEEARFLSMSLVDSSITHLHGLMKSVASDQAVRVNPNVVNAACNCAKQMQGLLKFKLEAFKTFSGRAG